MGNSSAKEQRPPPGRSSSAQAESARQPHSRSVSENSGLPSQPGTASLSTSSIAASRPGRGSRPDLSFLSLNHSSERDVASLDTRRDARQERETRRLERERAAREKERERSMREESIDGGYLVTQGVYTGTEDYSKPIVRRLMIERRLAPFFRGLNEHSAAWRDEQLVAAVKGVPLTAEPRPPSPRQARASAHRAAAAAAATVAPASSTRDRDQNQDHDQDQNSKTLTGESCSRSRSYTSESSTRLAPSHPALSNANTNTISSTALLAPSSPPFRPRSKTLASLTSLAKNHSQDDMTPQEIHLPKPVHVDGRPVEAFLYRNASECPICFLFYPPYLNRTRCCDQSICSECFVQIKRPDPHPPEHAEPGSHAQAQQDDAAGARESLVMEPAACPFCVQSELGVTYEPPPFRSGLVYAGQTSTVSSLVQVTSAMSSSSSLSSFSGQPSQTRRRTDSLSPTSSTVVTTDRIRPDWSQKLADANAHLARRSAAATALHSAAYSRGGLSFGTEGRSVLNFGRRTRPGRSTRTDDSGTGSSSASNVRSGDGADSMSLGLTDSDGDDGTQARAIRVLFGDHAGGSARRSRLQDLEDMMMEQAIRLSLVAEEERRQKEEREARAQQQQEEALMREGEGDGSGNSTRPALAAGKAPQRRTSHGSATAQASSGCQDHERSRRDGAPANGKGKAVDRGTIPPRSSPLAQGPSSAGDVSRPPTTTSRPLEAAEHHSWIGSSTMDSSQTRHASRRSSPVSLLPESITGSTHGPSETPATGRPTGSDNDSQRRTSTPSASGATNGDPVFAFSSLAAMMDDTGTGHDEKPDEHSGPERREASPSPPRELRGH